MIGLGTFYNALGSCLRALGLPIGQRLSEDFRETLLKVPRFLSLGIAGTLERCWWCMEVMGRVTAV